MDENGAAAPATRDGLAIIGFADAPAFAAWLAGRDETTTGAWLRFAKKGSGTSTLSQQEAIDCALCEGWIDGQAAPQDERFFLVRFTPRRPRSNWSKVNRARAAELIAEGRMRPRGLRETDTARADGRWDRAYPSVPHRDGPGRPPRRAGRLPRRRRAVREPEPVGAVRHAPRPRHRPEGRDPPPKDRILPPRGAGVGLMLHLILGLPWAYVAIKFVLAELGDACLGRGPRRGVAVPPLESPILGIGLRAWIPARRRYRLQHLVWPGRLADATILKAKTCKRSDYSSAAHAS